MLSKPSANGALSKGCTSPYGAYSDAIHGVEAATIPFRKHLPATARHAAASLRFAPYPGKWSAVSSLAAAAKALSVCGIGGEMNSRQ